MDDDVIKWKDFPRYWPFVRGIHRSPVNSQHKGQWRGALMLSLICAWINNCEAGDLWRHRAYYDVIVIGWARMSPYERGNKGKASLLMINTRWSHRMSADFTDLCNLRYVLQECVRCRHNKVPNQTHMLHLKPDQNVVRWYTCVV